MESKIYYFFSYFAHFFVPPTLPVIPKIVVFLIDVSGSMLGYKIEQVREALSTTLRGLNEHVSEFKWKNNLKLICEKIPTVKQNQN